MLVITICVGSSCSVRGSDELAARLQQCIEKEHLEGLVDIVGAFCMDACSQGVSVRVGDRQFSGILPQDAETFFYDQIIGQVDRSLLAARPPSPQ
jgi:NADH:ubiquinone oxidoreductase subunit E